MKAWQLIEKPENWCRGVNAKDKDGNSVKPGSPDAVSFCILGAIIQCYGLCNHRSIASKVEEKLNNGSMAIFNDTHTHAEVLALLKELDV